MNKMNKGVFYGVSVGPGDPDLITLKAIKVIQNVNIIATPRTKGENTLALDIVSQAVDINNKEIIKLDFLMSRDKELVHSRHLEIASQIKLYLDKGQDVAMLNLGDVSVFSTFSYIMDILAKDGYQVDVIPGVTSFCSVASTLKMSLTSMNEPLHIMPASNIDDVMNLSGTKVIMKAGKSMPKVKQSIIQNNLQDRVKGVQNCGLPDEKICHDFNDISDDLSYFTTLIIN